MTLASISRWWRVGLNLFVVIFLCAQVSVLLFDSATLLWGNMKLLSVVLSGPLIGMLFSRLTSCDALSNEVRVMRRI